MINPNFLTDETDGTFTGKFIIDNGSATFVKSPYQELYKEIKELKNLLDFNGYYMAFLLSQTTEKEFVRLTKKFIRKND